MAKKAKKKKAPSPFEVRHARVVKRISDSIRNGRPVSRQQAMLEEGYSPSYAASSHITTTDPWQKLMEEHLPDDLLAEVHEELLTNEAWKARDAALDKAYKLKKRYDNTINLKGGLSTVSDAEIDDRIAGILSGIISSLTGEGSARKE